VKRQGNNPKRRLAAVGSQNTQDLDDLASRACYVGSGHHKRYPADHGLERTNPRPTKSLCDRTKVVNFENARRLLANGINAGMTSEPSVGGFPKYVWCVDDDGTVYEAKTDPKKPGTYHGYPLEIEDHVRLYILAEWKRRCP